MSLGFERWYPWLLGAFGAALSWLLSIGLPADANLPSLLSSAISVSAILVGFLATMKSIMMAIPTVVERLKTAGYLDDLAGYLMQATSANLLFCVLSISGFFPLGAQFAAFYAPLWFGIGVFALLSFWRVTRIMVLILRWNGAQP